jgi:hypothetical protein
LIRPEALTQASNLIGRDRPVDALEFELPQQCCFDHAIDFGDDALAD